jgi:hypothetical protein
MNFRSLQSAASLVLLVFLAGASEDALAYKCSQGGATWTCAPGVCKSGGECSPKNPVISVTPIPDNVKRCVAAGAQKEPSCRLIQTSDSVVVKEPPVNPGTIFDRWGNMKTKQRCETGGGVWDGSSGQGGCTGPRPTQK